MLRQDDTSEIEEVVRQAVKHDIGRGFDPDRPVKKYARRRHEIKRWTAVIGTATILFAGALFAAHDLTRHGASQPAQSTVAAKKTNTATAAKPSIVASVTLAAKKLPSDSQFKDYNPQGFKLKIAASNVESPPQVFIVPVSTKGVLAGFAGFGGYGIGGTTRLSQGKGFLFRLLKQQLNVLGFDVSSRMQVMYGTPPSESVLFVKTQQPVPASSIRFVILHLQGRGSNRHVVWAKILAPNKQVSLPVK